MKHIVLSLHWISKFCKCPCIHLHLHFDLTLTLLIFNQFKWRCVKTREDNTVYLVYSWKPHVLFIEKLITEQRSFGNIISAVNTFRNCRSCYTLQITSVVLLPLLFYFPFLFPHSSSLSVASCMFSPLK